jgi:hypothetical protein
MAESTGGLSAQVEPTQSTTQGMAQKAQDKVQDVAGQAREQAEQVRGQASGRVQEQIDQRSTQAGQQVSSTADDLRSVAEELRKKGKDTPARLAEQVADRTQKVGGYLQGADADQLLNDLEDFARRQPWAVVVGGIILGFAASRFLKASGAQRYESRNLSGHTSTRSRQELLSTRGATTSGLDYASPAGGRSLDDDELPVVPSDVAPAGPVVTGADSPTATPHLDDVTDEDLTRSRSAGF